MTISLTKTQNNISNFQAFSLPSIKSLKFIQGNIKFYLKFKLWKEGLQLKQDLF